METVTLTYFSAYSNADGEYPKLTYDLPVMRIKVSDVYEAVLKNGFEYLRGEWFNTLYKDGKEKVIGGCVLGQAALNLNILADSSEDGPQEYKFPALTPDVANEELTDLIQEYSLLSALNNFNNKSTKWPSDTITNQPCGNAIISWNDKTVPPDGLYAIPTYEEVAEMVKDILAPYFDREILVAIYEYDKLEKAAVS